MPFTISIAINKKAIWSIHCRNCGPPSGGHESATRIYRYCAENVESGGELRGEILHQRDKGIELLSGLILMDIASKTNSFR